jgi:hypothetical protein
VLERLKGYERVYETEVTDGYRRVSGRGPTREASLAEAERRWLEQPDSEQEEGQE